jgi:hypothetical protein
VRLDEFIYELAAAVASFSGGNMRELDSGCDFTVDFLPFDGVICGLLDDAIF